MSIRKFGGVSSSRGDRLRGRFLLRGLPPRRAGGLDCDTRLRAHSVGRISFSNVGTRHQPPAQNPIVQIVHSDPEITGGELVFAGTRVPVYNLFDYFEAGDWLYEFLAQFPSVSREQAVASLELAKEAIGGA